MEEQAWRERAAAVWRWARRMIEGVPRGGRIRLVDFGMSPETGARPVISIVLGQWPGPRVGDAVVSGGLSVAEIRRVVAAAGRSGLRAPAWRVHGIEAVPRGSGEVARWLVGWAEASAGGAVAVDTAEMDEQTRGGLEAHLRRLAPRADVSVERDGKESKKTA